MAYKTFGGGFFLGWHFAENSVGKFGPGFRKLGREYRDGVGHGADKMRRGPPSDNNRDGEESLLTHDVTDQ